MHVQCSTAVCHLLAINIYYILNHKVDLWRAMIPLPATNSFMPAVMSQNHEFDSVRGNLERTILDLSSRKKRSFFREGTTKPMLLLQSVYNHDILAQDWFMEISTFATWCLILNHTK